MLSSMNKLFFCSLILFNAEVKYFLSMAKIEIITFYIPYNFFPISERERERERTHIDSKKESLMKTQLQ